MEDCFVPVQSPFRPWGREEPKEHWGCGMEGCFASICHFQTIVEQGQIACPSDASLPSLNLAMSIYSQLLTNWRQWLDRQTNRIKNLKRKFMISWKSRLWRGWVTFIFVSPRSHKPLQRPIRPSEASQTPSWALSVNLRCFSNHLRALGFQPHDSNPGSLALGL